VETIAGFLSDDHQRCDRLFSEAEHAVAREDWEAASAKTRSFMRGMENHFAMEEKVLFPAFEKASGNTTGPTVVMRHEHEQMRRLFSRLEQAMRERDANAYLGEAETLLVLMQQHNAKEEQLLYPMSDRVFGASREMVERMRAQLV